MNLTTMSRRPLCVRNYVRYMDDFVIIDESKEKLHGILNQIRIFIGKKLHLELNPKTDIFKISQGVDFCGYRVFPAFLLPRKRNVKSTRRRLKKLAKDVRAGRIGIDKFQRSLQSYLGYSKHCKAYNTVEFILKDLIF